MILLFVLIIEERKQWVVERASFQGGVLVLGRDMTRSGQRWL